ncbi:hypothetical protein GMDG_07911 [Pseudogymnoascus destructans 20631-21]|uniref:DNA/RNA-binding protein Alba-like domain-containing protein n=1 Tax=Pseudogymnoascus destructans (strain ATCC MYA-4855 / 20631-21) TaxID=658429 RepID=L8FZ80_PSED2|nr:hypothetical protein GMDG_07911 [Pseudogymnoascus destructans 20631-21]
MPSAQSKPKKAHGKQTAHRPAAKPPSTKPSAPKKPSPQPTTMKLPITTATSSKRPTTHDTLMPPPAKKPRPSPPTTTTTPITPTSTPTTPHLHPSLTPTTHTLHATQILTSTKMHTKITTLLTQLRSFSFAAPAAAAKPVIVIAWAKAKSAGKLVSVMEVVKREIGGEGGCGFSITGLGRGLGGGEGWGGGEDGEGDVEMEEDEGFEMMKTRVERAIEGTEKLRSVPVMTVYLSRVRIEALREAYGEQTNSKR